VSLLSKHVIRFRGSHIFNPSNFGLVLCFLVLGKNRADPLDFWWAPMSPWLALAFAIIVFGGLVILSRLRLLGIAVAFWAAFAASIAVLAASGHAMTARWHLGPISGAYFWWVLVSSPELLVFLFFMITDPKTIPAGRGARLAYAVAVALVAALLIAPQRTEFGSKVALLAALAVVCAARPLIERFRPAAPSLVVAPRRVATGSLVLAGAVGFVALLLVAGIPARSSAEAANVSSTDAHGLPRVTFVRSKGVSSEISGRTGVQIARDVVADLRLELRRQIRAAGGRSVAVPTYVVERMSVTLEPGRGQAPPTVAARSSTTSSRRALTVQPPEGWRRRRRPGGPRGCRPPRPPSACGCRRPAPA
jgi:hypothetical protein